MWRVDDRSTHGFVVFMVVISQQTATDLIILIDPVKRYNFPTKFLLTVQLQAMMSFFK